MPQFNAGRAFSKQTPPKDRVVHDAEAARPAYSSAGQSPPAHDPLARAAENER